MSLFKKLLGGIKGISKAMAGMKKNVPAGGGIGFLAGKFGKDLLGKHPFLPKILGLQSVVGKAFLGRLPQAQTGVQGPAQGVQALQQNIPQVVPQNLPSAQPISPIPQNLQKPEEEYLA